ncbi:hypothetical protein I9W82_004355 [Candida metapsilosis]|uniref:Histone-binding protein RBBP4-like N-terminal domain-containing protein n=1 Tax=Candida metapsilosis TaxID=273372 RepID=A0A8H8DBR2_9ASCO|nr:hypothetical protein I9W82_004355 [Candida metapsilosis]
MPSSTTNEWAKAEKEIAQEQQLQEKITNEEFKIWKKTVPLLYDIIHTFALDHPSTIVQWLPKYQRVDNDNAVEVQFLLSSNSINALENSLELASMTLPSSLIGKSGAAIPADGIDTSNFKKLTKWKQNSVANALKLSPDGSTALCFNGDGIIHAYNLSSDKVVDYKYHKQSGFALDWIKNDTNAAPEKFLSGGLDSQIALWQLDKPSTPIQLFKSHHGAINDISTSDVNIFGSVSDDSTTQFHDLRTPSIGDTTTNPVIKLENKFIQNCIKFHPHVSTLYATAGKDNVVSLYDLRNYKQPFRKLFGHNASVRQLEWDKWNPQTLVSCGLDSRVLFWDLDNLEEDYTYPETGNATTTTTETSKRKTQQANKPDPCLKYVHGGHVGRINDFAIHPTIPNLFASVGDDRLLEVWKPKTLPVEEEEEEEDEVEEDEVEEEEEEAKREADKEKNEEENDNEKEKEKSSEAEADAGKSSKDEEDASSSKDVEMKD